MAGDRIATGVPGLDDVLGGGLPARRLHERSRQAGFDLHLATPPDLDVLERAMIDVHPHLAGKEEKRSPRPVVHTPAHRRSAEKAPRHLVLLVDDDDDLRSTLMDVLAEDRYEVVEAQDGLTAIALVTGGLRPDAILLDYRMPGLHGGEVHERLRVAGVAVPTVLITAAQAAPELAKRHGIPHHLGKPFGAEELLSMLKRVVGDGATSPDQGGKGGSR